MSLKDALSLKNKVVEIDGVTVNLRRPSLADLAMAIEMSEKSSNFTAWLVFNHVMEDGKQYFQSEDDVLKCDGVFVEKIANEIDLLYGEGRDLPRQQ